MTNLIIIIISTCIIFIGLIFSFVWRKKKYVKGGLSQTLNAILIFVTLSLLNIILYIINNENIFSYCIICLLLTVVGVPIAVKSMCFCIYIEKNEVIKRYFFKETRINVAENSSFAGFQNGDESFYIIISADKKRVIMFRKASVDDTKSKFYKKIEEIKKAK